MEYTNKSYYLIGEEKHDFAYNLDLSFNKKSEFVHYVSRLIVNEFGYFSLRRNIAFDYGILTYFTDIDPAIFVSMDEDVESSDEDEVTEVAEAYVDFGLIDEFVSNTNIMYQLKSNIDFELIDELNNAVDNFISYKTGIHKDTITTAVVELLSDVKKFINVYGSRIESLTSTSSNDSLIMAAEKISESGGIAEIIANALKGTGKDR